MKAICVSIQMKAIAQKFHMVLYIMLWQMVQTVDETTVRGYSDK